MSSSIRIVWTDRLATGVRDIDDQHRQLFSILNQLAEQAGSSLDVSAVRCLVHELKSYASYHFRLEENLMESWPVDPLKKAVHLRAHAGFVDYLRRIEPLLDTCEQGMVDNMVGFFVKWLAYHIGGIDARMVAELRALGMPIEATSEEKVPGVDELLNAVSELYEVNSSMSLDLLETQRRLAEEIARREAAESKLRAINGEP